MSTKNRCSSGTSLILSFLVILSVSDNVNADGLAEELKKRSSLQSAEIDLIQAQLKFAEWRYVEFKDLYAKGFASWLELRRHKLVVDSIAACLTSAREFRRFLTDLETEQTIAAADQTLVLRERNSLPIKVFLPGSIRIIGWIEGQSLSNSTETTTNGTTIKKAEEKLAKAQKRFDETNKLPSCPASWREKASLDLNLANKEFKYVKAFKNFQKQSIPAAAFQSISIDEITNFVTAHHRAKLKLATSNVSKAEASAFGHIDGTRIMLDRERRRADTFRQLQSKGYASANELKTVNDRVSKIQLQLDALKENQTALSRASLGWDDSHEPIASVSYDSISTWPVIVFNDKEFASHLIDLRHKYHNETSNAEIARMRSDMLLEVTIRLKVAAKKTNPNSGLGAVLNEGQRNEIKAYDSDIEFAKANAVAANEKQRILIHEENRFIHQAIAQHDAARNRAAKSNAVLFGPLGMLSLVHPTGVSVSNGTSKALTHFSYLESGRLNTLSGSFNFLFSQSHRNFIGSASSIDSIHRFNLGPVQSYLLTSGSSRRYSSASGLQVEPDWMDYLRCNVARNSHSILPYPQRSIYTDLLHRNCYGHYGYRSYGIYNAYPNGILRSELRSRAPVGQLPWYLPGSPSNVRPYDFRLGHHGHNYNHF